MLLGIQPDAVCVQYRAVYTSIQSSNRVPTDLEKSGNFTNLEKSGRSQGISPKVRELFEAGLSSKANHPRLLKWTYAG